MATVKISTRNGFYLIKSLDDVLYFCLVMHETDERFSQFNTEWLLRVENIQQGDGLSFSLGDYQYLKDEDKEDEGFHSRTRWWAKKDSIIGWFKEEEGRTAEANRVREVWTGE